MSYVDLASKVSQRMNGCTHIRNMEENGTIRGYTIREGGVGRRLVESRFHPVQDRFLCLQARARRWNVYEVSGEADLVALVHVDDTMALRCFSQNVAGSTQ